MRTDGKAQTAYCCMNTLVSHTVYGKHAERALRMAQCETRRLESRMSRFIAGSDIHRLNSAAGVEPVKMHRDVFAVLEAGILHARQTDGRFDITVNPLARLWEAGSAQPTVQEIDDARELVGFQKLLLHRKGRKAYLPKAGQCVDLGGIGKGYAADRMLDVFRRCGVRSAFTNFGGNVAVLGSKPDGSPWKIGIRHPLRADRILGILSVADQSVVTSGDDQRAVVTPDGKHRSHIIDPLSGMPANAGLLSVTVVSPSSTLADALATALYAAGMRQGLQILKRYPGTQAVFIDCDASVFLTGGLERCFEAAQGTQTTVFREETI